MFFLRMVGQKIWMWAIAAVGLLITGLAVTARTTMKENRRLRRHVESAEAKVKHAQAVSRDDIKQIQEEQIREAQIAKDLEDRKSNYDPNELFNNRKDGDS